MQVVNPIEIKDWDLLVGRLKGSTIFHTAGWARVLSETYRYHPKYFVQYRDGGLSSVVPFMELNSFLTKKRGVSLPFTDFISPLLGDVDNLDDILGNAVAYARRAGWKRMELRGVEQDALKEKTAAEFLTHNLLISQDKACLESGVRKSALRNVRKALREGVVVKCENTQVGVRRFYRLNCLTRRRHGYPPQPFAFFDSINRNILSRGMGNLFLASLAGKYIAGAVFFHFKDQVLFKFGASDVKYHWLGINNLVMWEAIMHYSSGNYRNFNFGRTEPGNNGLKHFKTGWGATESRVFYYTYDLFKGDYVEDSPLVKDWQKKVMMRTPLPILRLIGSLFHKHVG